MRRDVWCQPWTRLALKLGPKVACSRRTSVSQSISKLAQSIRALWSLHCDFVRSVHTHRRYHPRWTSHAACQRHDKPLQWVRNKLAPSPCEETEEGRGGTPKRSGERHKVGEMLRLPCRRHMCVAEERKHGASHGKGDYSDFFARGCDHVFDHLLEHIKRASRSHVRVGTLAPVVPQGVDIDPGLPPRLCHCLYPRTKDGRSLPAGVKIQGGIKRIIECRHDALLSRVPL
mmetsp:Transcript_41610/g.81297  ORF Transcript_41610/g.81297 Transcript_41610/m.81297 type:complete len:230 (-) Transcript_41610:583-1272(-)